jgi:proteasome lid subunit RPN8/RPN11
MQRQLPNEACGFLLAKRSTAGQPLSCEFALSARTTPRVQQFEIPDAELRRTRAWANDRGLEVVAIFHSHPSGDLRLSAADRAGLEYSEWPWVVVTRDSRSGRAVLTGYAGGNGGRLRIVATAQTSN